jgi:hypothetical protein
MGQVGGCVIAFLLSAYYTLLDRLNGVAGRTVLGQISGVICSFSVTGNFMALLNPFPGLR